jgi:hypothetical protein
MKLLKALEEYLTLRRALGFILAEPSRLLHKFVTYAKKEGASFITTELAVRWAMQPTCQPAQWARYLSMVRMFARYVRGPRSLLAAFFRIALAVRSPTYIPTRRYCI